MASGVGGNARVWAAPGEAVSPPPVPPPPPPPPQNVAPTALEAQRVAGEKNIVPDDKTKTEIARSGKDRLIGSFKLCLSVDGDVMLVQQLRSTGFPDYDAKIAREIRQHWRYTPFLINGAPAPVCTAVTFIYSQRAPGDEPAFLSPRALAALRTEGADIDPSDETKQAIVRSPKGYARAIVGVCLTASGEFTNVKISQSSGYPEYDAKLVRGVGEWRYGHHVVNGQAAPACGQVSIVYPRPRAISSAALEARRQSGPTTFEPEQALKDELVRRGEHRVTSVFKVCVSAAGRVEIVEPLVFSGYSNYDVQIMLALKERTYRPIAPQPELSCGEVALEYKQ